MDSEAVYGHAGISERRNTSCQDGHSSRYGVQEIQYSVVAGESVQEGRREAKKHSCMPDTFLLMFMQN